MKRKQKINLQCAIMVFVMGLFLAPFFVSATPASDAGIQPEIVEVQVVSQISIENAKVVSQNGNEIKVAFDLFNGGKNIQPDIFYSIKLMEQKETYQTIAETKNYPDSVDLSAGERAHKEVVYNAPDFLTGNFPVWVEAHNSKGTPLMQAFIGEVELKGSAGYISIEKDTCNVKVQGEEIKYDPGQGVDISLNEALVGTCLLKNNFPVAKQAGIRFEVRYRSVSGNIVSNSKGEDISLEAGGQKEVSFVLPKEKKPQAYEIKMFLVGSDEKKNSNEALFHYVLAGKSVTIQNVSLNSDGYERGSQAKISFFLSSSADSFIDSRKGGTNTEEVFAIVEMRSKDGKNCLDRNEYKIESNFYGEINLDIPVINSCQNPSVVVSVKDKDGNILDSANFLMDEKVKSPAESEKPLIPGMFTGKNILKILGLLALLLAVIIIVKKIKKRGAAMIFLLISFSALMAFGLPGNSKAAGGNFVVGSCYTHNGTLKCNTQSNYTVNLDKSTYAPGEQMVVSGSGFGGACLNGWAFISLDVTIPFPGGPFLNVFVINGGNGVHGVSSVSYSGSIYPNAPTTPGNYIARFQGYAYALDSHIYGTVVGTFDVPFTVKVPNQDPEGGVESGGNCSNGTINIWGWAIDRDALSTSIPVHFYEGSTYKGQCATSTFRSDINSAYGATGNHGFSCAISGFSAGNHTITTYGINTPTGNNPILPWGTNPQTINCPAAPPTCSVSYSPGSITAPGNSTATVTMSNATSATYGCTGPQPVASGSGLTVAASANYVFNFAAAQTGTERCTVSVSGSGGTGSCSGSVIVNPPAPTCTPSCGAWGACSKSCGGGTQSQSCTRANCSTYTNSQVCNTQVCNQNPEGATDGGSCSNGTISFWGWAIDRDALSTSIPVQFYEGATYKGQCATNTFRSDINSAYGATGNHGFSCSISGLSVGNHTITTYGVNTPVGTNPKLPYGTNPQTINCPAAACNLPWGGTIASGSNVTAYQNNSVPCGSSCVSQTRTCNNGTLSGSYTNQSCSVAACNKDPIGGVEGGSCSGGIITTWGWAFDLDDSSSSINVQLYEGVNYRGQCATSMLRSDINSTYGITGNHGFGCSKSGFSVGNHNFTVLGVNTPAGTNPALSGGNPITINCPAAVCTGAIPTNATICSNDDTGLLIDTPRIQVGLCGLPKCEYICNSGFHLNGGICQADCVAVCDAWGACSKSCGGGTYSRTCTQADCTIYTGTQACNTQACSTNTNWKEVAP